MIDIFTNDANFNEEDMRNRSWRLASASVNERLTKVTDLLAVATESGDDNELIKAHAFKADMIYDIVYDDIRDGLILPDYEIVELLDFFMIDNDTKKMNYLAWILNTYYKSDFLTEKMTESINKEDYELSSIIKNLLNIKVLPSVKE